MIFILRRKRRITVLMNKGILVGIWGRVYRLQGGCGYLGTEWVCAARQRRVFGDGRQFKTALPHANRAAFRRTNCQLRLRKAGEPAFPSLRKQWISPALRTPVNCLLRGRAVLNCLCTEILLAYDLASAVMQKPLKIITPAVKYRSRWKFGQVRYCDI